MTSFPQTNTKTMLELELENEALRRRVADLEKEKNASPTSSLGDAGFAAVESSAPNQTVEASPTISNGANCGSCREISRESLGKAGMTAAEIARYSRHLLVPVVGVEGQRNMFGKTCLVIGAGGLASALLPYLAGAGVGHIKIIDFDKIETSNLHRQVLYRESQAGKSKALCAVEAVRAINLNVRCSAIEAAFTHDNALSVMADCDLVVDASDNPRTRYLVNDACVLSGKPLVFGSALGMEGQLSVLHFQGGPCYRCIFPAPLAAEAGRRCSDNGVLGTVPGVIGCLQATEALKVLGEFGKPLSGMLCTFDAQDGSFYTIRLRPRSKGCAACGDNPTVKTMEDSAAFATKHGLTVERTVPEQNDDVPSVTCQEYAQVVARGQEHLLLDVRVRVQFDVCALDGAVNLPLAELETYIDKVEALSAGRSLPVYCVCRRGVDSCAAVAILRREGFNRVKNVSGG